MIAGRGLQMRRWAPAQPLHRASCVRSPPPGSSRGMALPKLCSSGVGSWERHGALHAHSGVELVVPDDVGFWEETAGCNVPVFPPRARMGRLRGMQSLWVYERGEVRRRRVGLAYGEAPQPVPIQATRVVAGAEGPTVGAEHPEEGEMTLAFVPRTSDDDDGDWRRLRLEVKCDDKRLRGQSLVVAGLPYATRLAFAAPFRGPSHKAPDHLRTAAAREAADFEVYETGRRLTAAQGDLPLDDVDVAALDRLEGYRFGLVDDLEVRLAELRRGLDAAGFVGLPGWGLLQLLAGPGTSPRDGGWVGVPYVALLGPVVPQPG